MRKAWVVFMGLALVSCNSSSSSQWREISQDTKESRFEQAKAICNGRASETALLGVAGRVWIAGAVAADNVFKSCMAQQGFAPNA